MRMLCFIAVFIDSTEYMEKSPIQPSHSMWWFTAIIVYKLRKGTQWREAEQKFLDQKCIFSSIRRESHGKYDVTWHFFYPNYTDSLLYMHHEQPIFLTRHLLIGKATTTTNKRWAHPYGANVKAKLGRDSPMRWNARHTDSTQTHQSTYAGHAADVREWVASAYVVVVTSGSRNRFHVIGP